MSKLWEQFKGWWNAPSTDSFDVYESMREARQKQLRDAQIKAAEIEYAKARVALCDGFAKAALTGLLANPSHDTLSPEEWASDAYNIANAMMKARERVAE